MDNINVLEQDVYNMVNKLQITKFITSFEADDIAQLLIRKQDRYKHTSKETLIEDILPILFSLVAENKLKLTYVATCPKCNIPMKETPDITVMAETLECYMCGTKYGYNGSGSHVSEKFYFTSKKIID